MIDRDKWTDWEWQQQNSISNAGMLLEYFPKLNRDVINYVKTSTNKLKFKVTPYLLSLVKKDIEGLPLLDDPIWQQIVPSEKLFNSISQLDFNKMDINWEDPSEMINPILHHKYFNRAVLRIQNNCLAYCMYCFESRRTLDKSSNIPQFNDVFLKEALEYLNVNKQIDEIILSGGEPLLLSNKYLKFILEEIRKIKNIKLIRIHTRTLTHNPYRFDNELIKLINNFDITSINVHFTHPNEVTNELEKIITNIRNKSNVILLAHIPLLKKINNDASILIKLFMKLYELKIIPYYLLHAMPNTLGSNIFRTKVIDGVKIMRKLKRKYSNPAIPEYIIVHKSSKHTVPFELEGTSEFQYHDGFIRFKNYKGDWCIYDEI